MPSQLSLNSDQCRILKVHPPRHYSGRVPFQKPTTISRLSATPETSSPQRKLSTVSRRNVLSPNQRIDESAFVHMLSHGFTSFHPKSCSDAVEIAKLSLSELTPCQKYDLLELQSGMGTTALHLAALQGKPKIVRDLLKKLDLEQKNHLLKLQTVDGYTPLHFAVERGDVKIVRYLLEFYIQEERYDILKIKDCNGLTALHRAVIKGDEELIKELLKNLGKQCCQDLLKTEDSRGYTAINKVIKSGNATILRCLLKELNPESRLNLLVKKNQWTTALHYVAFRGDAETAKVLGEILTPDQLFNLLRIRNQRGYTALHYAAHFGHTGVISCFLDRLSPQQQLELLHGENPERRDNQGVAELCRLQETKDYLQKCQFLANEIIERRGKPYTALVDVEQRLEAIIGEQSVQIRDQSIQIEKQDNNIRERDAKFQQLEADTKRRAKEQRKHYRKRSHCQKNSKSPKWGAHYTARGAESGKHQTKRQQNPDACSLLGLDDAISRQGKESMSLADEYLYNKNDCIPNVDHTAGKASSEDRVPNILQRAVDAGRNENGIDTEAEKNSYKISKQITNEKASKTYYTDNVSVTLLTDLTNSGVQLVEVDTNEQRTSLFYSEEVSTAECRFGGKLVGIPELAENLNKAPLFVRRNLNVNHSEACPEIDDNNLNTQQNDKHENRVRTEESITIKSSVADKNASCIESTAQQVMNTEHFEYYKAIRYHVSCNKNLVNYFLDEESIVDRNYVGLHNFTDRERGCLSFFNKASDDDDHSEDDDNDDEGNVDQDDRRSSILKLVSANDDGDTDGEDGYVDDAKFGDGDVGEGGKQLSIVELVRHDDDVDDEDDDDDGDTDNDVDDAKVDDGDVGEGGRRSSILNLVSEDDDEDGDTDDEDGYVDDVKVDDGEVDEGGRWFSTLVVVGDYEENSDNLVDENINLTVKVSPVEKPDERDNQTCVASLEKQLLETAADNPALSVEEEALTTVDQEVSETLSVNLKDHPKKGEEDISPGRRCDDDRWHDDLLYEVRDILKGEVVCHAVKYSSERFAAVFNAEYHKYSVSKTRLLSYKDRNDSIMPSFECCEAGFFSTNNGDEIVCFQCLLGLRNFTERVDAIAIHQTHSYNFKCSHLEKIDRTLIFTTTYEFTTLAPKPSVIPQTFPSSGAQTELSLVTTNIGGAGLDLAGDISQLERMSEYERYKLYEEPRKKKKKTFVAKVDYLPAIGDLKYEISRRQTFANSAFISPATAKRLAADGFFLSKNKISCTFCSHSYEVYEAVDSLDDVLTRHHKNGACLLRDGNVPYMLKKQCYEGLVKSADTQTSETSQLAQLGVVVELSKHPEFAVDTRRTATFLTYPYHSATSSRTEELAEAGYYYSGEEDSVTCFSCGVTSSKWEPEEGVWQRHARSSTRCQFVLSQKGAGFIAQMIETSGEYREPRVENKINSVTTRTLRPRWDSNAVQGALDLRQEREKVKTVVNNRIMKGARDFVLMADIVREISELPKPDQDLTPPLSVTLPAVSRPPNPKPHKFTGFEENEEETLEQQEPTVEETVAGTRMEDSDDIIGQSDTNGDETESPESNPEIFRQIATQLTCKICLSSAVGIIFLPCGHLVCCTSCAAALQQCPICRSDVNGTVKINF